MQTNVWQPFTFRGVAAFASAAPGRALVVALVMAGVVASVIFRLLSAAWFPALDAAVARLPASGQIAQGRLHWPPEAPATLADSAWLSIVVNPTGQAFSGQSSDLQLELEPAQAHLSSLLGYLALPYPRSWVMALNRPDVEPVWGAWRPYLLLGASGAVGSGMLIVWALLGALVAGPVRLYSAVLQREATFGGCWRLAVAALMPGALIMSLAILLYSLRRLTLVELLLFGGLHLVCGVVYLSVAPWFLPRRSAVSPFAPTPASAAPPLPPSNPFASPEPPATNPPSAPPGGAPGHEEEDPGASAPAGS